LYLADRSTTKEANTTELAGGAPAHCETGGAGGQQRQYTLTSKPL